MRILHPFKSIKDWWYKPVARVEAIMPSLLKLRTDIRSLGCESDLDAIVLYFRFVSRLYDHRNMVVNAVNDLKEVNHGQYTALIGLLEEVTLAIIRSGRDRSGLNRTEEGRAVTAQNIFLGYDEIGVHSVEHWKKQKGEKDQDLFQVTAPDNTPYQKVCAQAGRFVRENGSVICDRIKEIDDLLAFKK